MTRRSVYHGRRGTTLIELIVVLAVQGTLMMILVGIIVTAFRIETESRRGFEQREARERLAEDFRRDVNAARSFALASSEEDAETPSPLLTLRFPETRNRDAESDEARRVVYRQTDEYVQRHVFQGEKQLARNRYVLPEGMRVEVVPFDEAESILVLRLEPEEQEVARGRRDAMTLAVLDDDRRHLANPEATEPKPDGPEETEKGADSE